MRLFEKRPLSLILCIMLGGFSLFSNLKPVFCIVSLCLAVVLFASTFIFKTKIPMKMLIFRASLIAFSVSIIWSQLFVFTFYPTKQMDEDVVICGTVISSDHTTDYQSTLVVEVDKIDDKADFHTFVVRGSKEHLSGINRGDEIEALVHVNNFENTSSFDTKGYYNSMGYSAEAEVLSVPTIKGRGNSISLVLYRLREGISNRFKLLTDSDTGGLLTALVIGDRSGLDANTLTNFDRTGTTHILAVSGMHLVIIAAALSKILKLFRLNRRVATATNLLICFLYVALTGFAASVTRAFVMMLVSGVLYLLSETRDSITSLFISIFIIILIQPYSLYDLSLWLSAFAALGVICYGNLFEDKLNGKNIFTKALYYVLGAILTTVFALSATYILCAFKFDGFSLIGAPSTVILSPFFTFLLYAGILLLIVGDIIPFGFILSDITDFVKYITDLASSPKWVKASFDFAYVKILVVLLTVFLFVFLVFTFKRRKLAIAILLTLFLAVNVSGLIGTQLSRYDDTVTYESVVGADTFIIKSDGTSSLIYAGGSSSKALYNTCDHITASRITYIDNIVLTHYSNNTLYVADVLLSSARCEYLYVPTPKSETELEIAEELALNLSTFSAKLKFYDCNEPLTTGAVKYTLLHRECYTDDDTLPSNIFLISNNGETLTYVSRGVLETNIRDAAKAISSGQTLVIGGYGETSSSGYEFDLRFKNLKRILISTSIPLEKYTEEYYEGLKTEITYISGRTEVTR